MTSHDERECSYLCGPKYIRVACCLGAALHHALVYRPELVHVVALVGAASGVEEREHSGYQKARLVHGNCVGAGQYCAGFSVFSLTVAEEKRVVCREQVCKVAGLPYEAARHYHPVADVCPRAYDEILCGYVRSYVHRGFGITVHRTVVQP